MFEYVDFDMKYILLIFVSIIITIVLYFIYNENIKSNSINDKINNLKLDCPKCPSCPSCPDVKCPKQSECPPCPGNDKCPDLKCPDCPVSNCPPCPSPQNIDCPTVNEIVSGIFPGRDQALTLGGYYPAQT